MTRQTGTNYTMSRQTHQHHVISRPLRSRTCTRRGPTANSDPPGRWMRRASGSGSGSAFDMNVTKRADGLEISAARQRLCHKPGAGSRKRTSPGSPGRRPPKPRATKLHAKTSRSGSMPEWKTASALASTPPPACANRELAAPTVKSAEFIKRKFLPSQQFSAHAMRFSWAWPAVVFN